MNEQSELKKLLMEDTKNSLLIEFDNETQQLVMKGRSFPANSQIFFIPLFEWTQNYIKSNPTHTTLDISFVYLYSRAGKQLFDLMKLLNESKKNGNQITINWNYEDGDEDMRQLGKDFSSVLNMEFNFGTFEI